MIICQLCANPNEPGSDFCASCGTFLAFGGEPSNLAPMTREQTATLTYTSGSEWSPEDRFGRCVLVIRADGGARLDRNQRGQASAWQGRVPPAILGEVLLDLFRAGFPEVPHSMIPPGSGRYDIQLRSGPTRQTATVHGYVYRQMPGYREAIELLDAIVRQLSLDAIRVGPRPGRAVVTDAQPAAVDA